MQEFTALELEAIASGKGKPGQPGKDGKDGQDGLLLSQPPRKPDEERVVG